MRTFKNISIRNFFLARSCDIPKESRCGLCTKNRELFISSVKVKHSKNVVDLLEQKDKEKQFRSLITRN